MRSLHRSLRARSLPLSCRPLHADSLQKAEIESIRETVSALETNLLDVRHAIDLNDVRMHQPKVTSVDKAREDHRWTVLEESIYPPVAFSVVLARNQQGALLVRCDVCKLHVPAPQREIEMARNSGAFLRHYSAGIRSCERPSRGALSAMCSASAARPPSVATIVANKARRASGCSGAQDPTSTVPLRCAHRSDHALRSALAWATRTASLGS